MTQRTELSKLTSWIGNVGQNQKKVKTTNLSELGINKYNEHWLIVQYVKVKPVEKPPGLLVSNEDSSFDP